MERVMELERGSTRIYNCPMCQVDTPHTIAASRGVTYAVVCSNCASGSLVDGQSLQSYQAEWEEELRDILESLGRADDE